MGWIASLLGSSGGADAAGAGAAGAATGTGLASAGTAVGTGAGAAGSGILAPTAGSAFSWMPAAFNTAGPTSGALLPSWLHSFGAQLGQGAQGFVGYPVQQPGTAYQIGQTLRSNLSSGGGQPRGGPAPLAGGPIQNTGLQAKLAMLQQLGLL